MTEIAQMNYTKNGISFILNWSRLENPRKLTP